MASNTFVAGAARAVTGSADRCHHGPRRMAVHAGNAPAKVVWGRRSRRVARACLPPQEINKFCEECVSPLICRSRQNMLSLNSSPRWEPFLMLAFPCAFVDSKQTACRRSSMGVSRRRAAARSRLPFVGWQTCSRCAPRLWWTWTQALGATHALDGYRTWIERIIMRLRGIAALIRRAHGCAEGEG